MKSRLTASIIKEKRCHLPTLLCSCALLTLVNSFSQFSTTPTSSYSVTKSNSRRFGLCSFFTQPRATSSQICCSFLAYPKYWHPSLWCPRLWLCPSRPPSVSGPSSRSTNISVINRFTLWLQSWWLVCSFCLSTTMAKKNGFKQVRQQDTLP